MNNPFEDNQAAPVVNLMQTPESYSPDMERQVQELLSDMQPETLAAPSVGGKKKNARGFFVVLVIVVLLVAAGAVFFLMDSSSSAVNKAEEVAAPLTPPAPMVPPAPAPVAAPVVVPAPALVPPSSPNPADVCEQRMIDHAVQNGADPKAYVSENAAYLAECRKAYAAGAR